LRAVGVAAIAGIALALVLAPTVPVVVVRVEAGVIVLVVMKVDWGGCALCARLWTALRKYSIGRGWGVRRYHCGGY
jgi:hypothetical protein